MIQRVQSFWLLLAAVAAILTFKFPFYNGTQVLENMPSVAAEMNAASNLYTIVLTSVLIGLSLVAIFLYKTRKRQLAMTIFCLALSILIIVVYFMEMKKYTSGSLALWCIFAFAMPVCLLLAAQGIWRDQKLVKGLDRLR